MKIPMALFLLLLPLLVLLLALTPRVRVHEHVEGGEVWRYVTPQLAAGPAESGRTVTQCLWPGEGVLPGDEAPAREADPALAIGHAFCRRAVPEGNPRRAMARPYWRT